MASDSGMTGYLYLVTIGPETMTLNRQQLLGSMPKMLDGLERTSELCIRQIDQGLFARIVKQMLEADQT